MKCLKYATGAAVVSIAAMSAEAAIEKPAVLNDAVLSLTVSDVHGFMDEVGAVAAQISPMMNGAMLKNMLGMQLGDPNLAGIPIGDGFSIVALDPTNIFGVIELSAAQSSAYLSMAAAQDLQADYTNGLFVVAGSPEALKKGRGLAGKVKTTLLSNSAAELSIAMKTAEMIERNEEAVDGFMESLPSMLGMSMMKQPGATLESAQNTSKILEGELIVLLSLAAQCEASEIKLIPKGGSVQLSEIFVPKAGTRLATLMNAPAVNKVNPNIHSGLLGKGTIMMDFYFANPDAMGEFVGAEADLLISKMKLEGDDVAGIAEKVKDWYALYGTGSACEMVNFGDDGKMGVEYIAEMKDPAAALKLLKNMETDMKPFFQLYESLGMPMSVTFKENVRESGGVQIHQMAMKFDLEKMAAEQKEQMSGMGLDNLVYDVAVADGLMYYSAEGDMEDLMKRAKAGSADPSPLKARSVYPEGGFYYFDLDVGSYMAFVARMLPETPDSTMMKQQLSTMFQGVESVTSAGFKQNGIVQWSINIPGDLLAKYGQMLMMAQMQAMQQQQGQGGPMTAPAQ